MFFSFLVFTLVTVLVNPLKSQAYCILRLIIQQLQGLQCKLFELVSGEIMDKNRYMSQNLLKYAMAERDVLCYTKHPFIVSLDYAFQNAKRLFLLLEFCPGYNLHEF